MMQILSINIQYAIKYGLVSYDSLLAYIYIYSSATTKSIWIEESKIVLSYSSSYL